MANAARYTNLIVRLLRDDGGIVYLNGVEVFRSNMPQVPVDYLTFAASTVNSGPEEVTYFPTNLNAVLLRAGTNVLAVEIHQAYVTTSDVSFDLELVAFPPETLPRLGAHVGAGLTFTWPAWAADFNLYTATNLAPPVIWSPATGMRSRKADTWAMEVAVPTNSQRFFRLQSP